MVALAQQYDDLVDELYHLQLRSLRKEYTLDNMVEMRNVLKLPDLPFIHVAGTNGKGSVVTKIAAVLQNNGYRVGVFSSPHISTFRERIVINGEYIDKNEVVALLRKILEVGSDLTFFEATTCLAWMYFAKKNVDYAIMEVGLGGRLDATNIIRPLVTAITSIGMDHTNILGDSIESIAREKAGIIKRGVPVVLGPTSSLPVICEVAVERESSIIEVGGCFKNFDDENRAVAKAVVSVLDRNFSLEGLELKPRCRCQEILPGVILDVAHNPAGLEALFGYLMEKFPQKSFCVVMGFAVGKDYRQGIAVVQKYADEIHYVYNDHHRIMGPDDCDLSFDGSLDETLLPIIYHARNKGQLLVICGSFFIMSDVFRLLGVADISDNKDLNER